MEIGDRIRIKRNELGMTLLELANKIGVREATVQRYESGSIKNLKQSTISALSDALNVTPAYLMGWEDEDPSSTPPGVIRVPVYGVIPAGIPMSAIEEVLDYEEMPESRDTVGKEFFALRLKGDSMFPNYLDGDIVIFQRQDTCDSGKDCAVMVNGDDATFKRIERKTNGIMLKPLNPNYDTLFFTNKEIEELPVRLLGVAIEIRRKL